MQNGASTAVARAAASYHVRNGMPHTPEELSAEWICKKRDGKTVSFDPEKIRQALTRCFNSINPEFVATGLGLEAQKALVEKITLAVCNNLAAQKISRPEVEQVQRLVIQQLWSEGLFEAAEHYQNYREERRKAREQRPIAPEVVNRVLEDQKHFPSDLQYYQFMSKFSRWREEDKRRETWHEAVYDRVMPWFKRLPVVAGKVEQAEWDELSAAMFNLEAHPAMRVLQMAGPALDRCHVGVYNCAYQPMEDLFSFPEMLYILMQGTGAGFSVESDYVSELPRIKKQRGGKPDTIVVPDSTEGWCNSYFEGLQRWFDGYDVEYDVTGVRKKNARLKTKGGRASGPGPFLELMTFARNLILSKQGRFLDDLDCHDLSCMTGKIVQVGGVRRASEISLSDLLSLLMRNAKTGPWYDNHIYRTMANNSAVYNERPSADVFMAEWLALIQSQSGERGIFNREAAIKNRPARRAAARFGCNPCAEIILRPYEFCNLSIVPARPNDTLESLKRKVRLATIFGVMQSTATNFRFIRDDWRKNCEEERLLGVDISGHADCPLLMRRTNPDLDSTLKILADEVRKTKVIWARRFGINESAADTTVKPAGDSALFFDCGSGVSARFAKWQLRWVREGKDSPVSKFLSDSGVPHAPAPEAPEALNVFGFPKEAPRGAVTRNDMGALAQLEHWLSWKKNYAEHSVSATIYIEPHEWLDVGAWVYRQENWEHITGLSFLPKDNGRYTYAPNEELTKEQYEKFCADFPKLNWAKLQHYEEDDQTEGAQSYACTGDRCERV